MWETTEVSFYLQSFTNEDQLTVHKKKHDMMLNLNNNSKSAGFVGKISLEQFDPFIVKDRNVLKD